MRRLGLVVLMALLSSSVLAGPAHAGTWSSPDPVGDATIYAFDPEPEPCGTVTETPTAEGDIRRLVVRHTRDRIELGVRVSGLVDARNTAAFFTLVTPTAEWQVDVARGRGGVDVTWSRAPRITEDDLDECGYYAYGAYPRSCRGATGVVDLDAGRINASIPRRCFKNPRWVRAGVQVLRGKASDQWVPPGFDGDFTEPLAGRRVYAGPRH